MSTGEPTIVPLFRVIFMMVLAFFAPLILYVILEWFS